MNLPMPVGNDISRLNWWTIVDIMALGFLIYQIIMVLKGRRAARVLTGVGVIVVVYVIATALKLELLRTVIASVAPYTSFALIVMFQSEIRMLLARMGRMQWFGLGGRLQRREAVAEIVLAVREMAESKTGALIVIERDIGLRTFIESGVRLDAELSHDLLAAIFARNAALHDGAAIVQGARVAAAACFLPLTMNPALMRKLGTRHRAAIGVTEETDALAVIVSEETGKVSLAAYGEIEFDVTQRRLEERLTEHANRQDSRERVRQEIGRLAEGPAKQ